MEIDIKLQNRIDAALISVIRLSAEVFKNQPGLNGAGTNLGRVEIADLTKLSANVRHLRAVMSQELINCRRIGHHTLRYKELETEMENGLEILEQYFTLAHLLR